MTSTWVCNCGSPALDVRCRNAAPTNPSAGQHPDPVLAPPHPDRLRLQVAKRLAHRRVMRGPDRTTDPVIAQRPQQRHRLRGRERQIETGQAARGGRLSLDTNATPSGPRPASNGTSSSAPTVPANPRRAAPVPTHRPGASPRPGVIVLDPPGHRIQVVGHADQLADRQHALSPGHRSATHRDSTRRHPTLPPPASPKMQVCEPSSTVRPAPVGFPCLDRSL